MLSISIIHEDRSFLVIEKPAGFVVNRADSVEGETIQDWMDNKFKIQNSKFKTEEDMEFIKRSGVVHRLDKETSGLMVLAKNHQAFQNLKNQFKERKTQKEYIALVHGKIVPKQGTINLPLKRNILNRHKFCVDVDGKMARSAYAVERYLTDEMGNDYTLVKVQIFTGRTHQIRVHFSHLGYPLVSDPLYLGKRLKQDLTWCPRVFLHAAKLSFFHPETGSKLEYECTIPDDLEKTLSVLLPNI